MPWGWLHSQSLRRAELAWPEDDHGFACCWMIPSNGLISCSVCTCCIALGLLQSMQHPQIQLGQAVLSRHISCTLSQAASPSFSLSPVAEETGTNSSRGLTLLSTSGPALRMMSSSLSLLLMSHCKWKMFPCL